MKELEQLKELKKYTSKKRLAAEKWSKPWQTLIATALSARTKDDTTIPVAKELFKKYSLEKLAKAEEKDIQVIIRKINYHKTKSKNIINCAKILIKEYKGKVPVNLEKLVELPGVGRKTANVFLACMGKDAIGVDTHIAYISQKLKWTKSDKPDKIEEDLKKLFPKKHWASLNPILVRFGQTNKKKIRDEILEKIKLL